MEAVTKQIWDDKITNMVAERRLTAMMLQEAQAILLELVRSQECSKENRIMEEAVSIGLAFSPNTTQSLERAVEKGPRE